jgi:hypothetical protein
LTNDPNFTPENDVDGRPKPLNNPFDSNLKLITIDEIAK